MIDMVSNKTFANATNATAITASAEKKSSTDIKAIKYKKSSTKNIHASLVL